MTTLNREDSDCFFEIMREQAAALVRIAQSIEVIADAILDNQLRVMPVKSKEAHDDRPQ